MLNRRTRSGHLLFLALLLVWGIQHVAGAQAPPLSPPQTPSLIRNGGFESVSPSGEAADWSAYESGYTADDKTHRDGARSIRCVNVSASDRRGALFVARLEQRQPRPVQISGWSKALAVSGTADSEYSLYVDIQFIDGTYQYGEISPFSTGTHDWQRKQVTILPSKPIKQLSVYALFRNHSGTVWFDDFSATSQEHGFDGQALIPPVLPSGVGRGWFIRDVARGGDTVQPLEIASGRGLSALGVDLTQFRTDAGGSILHADLVNRTDHTRAVTVYYVERFSGAARDRTFWWNDVRDRKATVGRSDWSNLTRVAGIGAIEAISLYPFACVTSPSAGRALGVPPDLGPRVVRLGFEADTQLLYVAFDLALPAKADAAGRAPARVGIVRYDVDPTWGFRAAAAGFYQRFPDSFTHRAMADGIWMPFTDPSRVPDVADFGFAYHEGDNSVVSDERLGILSFHYTEPMTYWQPLAKDVPRTYAAALAAIRRDSINPKSAGKRPAQAVLLSGTRDASGAINVEFQNTPWADGAVWFLNPNPRLPHPKAEWTKAVVNFSDDEKARYGDKATGGRLDGEYLDSLESWADTLDFSAESQKYTTLPLTFTSDTHEPALPLWFSVYEYTAWLSRYLHDHGALLMANTALARFNIFAGPLDIMGIETNWGSGASFTPDSDAVFNFRRTMSGHKPYLLLQNTNFDQFGSAEVEKYLQRCLFYGVFPSMFSANASDHAYWETPRWYNRDRDRFRRYIPQIKKLSAAGWEPITYAHSSDPAVYVERFGTRYLTVLNSAKTAKTVTIYVEHILTAGHPVAGSRTIPLVLPPGEVRMLDLRALLGAL